MRRNGFTLIEIMAALLIFAIGGTLALSVLNYTCSQRLKLQQQAEAQLLADTLLKTLILEHQTDRVNARINQTNFNLVSNVWNWQSADPVPVPLQGTEVFPNRQFVWNNIILQSHGGIPGGVDNIGVDNVVDTASSYRDPNDYTGNNSLYEWAYSVAPAIDAIAPVSGGDILTLNRNMLNGQKWLPGTNPITEAYDGANNPSRVVTVVVCWPPSVSGGNPNSNIASIRERVTATSVIGD